MAAYGAALSLSVTLSQLGNTPNFPYPQITKLLEGVNSLKCFLEDNREVKRDFEFQIREAIYEAQDIIDNHVWSTHFLSPSEAEISKQIFCEDLERVEQRISSIAEMTTEEFNHQTLDWKISNSVWKSSDEICDAGPYPVVGRGDDINQLTDRLIGGSTRLEVIPIVGIAGIGKTTLANCFLDDPLTGGHFDATGFVRISINYNKRNTLLDLLGSIRARAGGIRVQRRIKYQYKWSDAIHQKTNDELEKHLHNLLKDKRYLILLDDIREEAIWNDLQKLFPDYNNRSRILLTSRNVDVAPACPHRLNFVSDEATLNLLVAKAFKGEPCPPHLAVIAKNIASGCRGLPLAVVIVGDLLSFAKPIAEYWEMVLSSIDTCGSHVDLIEALVLLTYNHLPQQLKVCILHMAIFPYTHGISMTKLIHLSIVERFSKDIKTAIDSFDELNRRGFLVVHMTSTLQSSTDFEIIEEVFHDFLVRKAKEEKFFLVLNKDKSCADTIYNQQRRLCIRHNIYRAIKDLSKYNSNSSVRSLLYYGPKNQYPLRAWSEDFKLLEVFDALEVGFYTFPPEILKSFQLRHLALSYNGRLPATVCNLRNLQILIVSHYHNFKCSGVPSYLPAEILNLKDLWHLQVRGSDLPEPPPGNDLLLENLFQLSDVSAHSCTQNILERIRHIMILEVLIESSPEDESLSFFSHLDILNRLAVFKCIVLYPDIGSKIVPSSIPKFPSTLGNLTLNGCGFPWEYMRAIAALPILRTLNLQSCAFQGPEWEVKTNEFTKLEFLRLEDMDYENWTFAFSTGSSFPVLKSLIISHCYKLRDIPSVFADSSTLEILEVVDCSKSTMNSALEIKEKILLNRCRCCSSTRFDIYSSKDD